MPVTSVNRQVIYTILGFQTSDGSVFDDAIDAYTYEIAYFEQKKAEIRTLIINLVKEVFPGYNTTSQMMIVNQRINNAPQFAALVQRMTTCSQACFL